MATPILLTAAKVTEIAVVEMQYLETAFCIFQILHAQHYCFSLWSVAGCYTKGIASIGEELLIGKDVLDPIRLPY